MPKDEWAKASKRKIKWSISGKKIKPQVADAWQRFNRALEAEAKVRRRFKPPP